MRFNRSLIGVVALIALLNGVCIAQTASVAMTLADRLNTAWWKQRHEQKGRRV